MGARLTGWQRSEQLAFPSTAPLVRCCRLQPQATVSSSRCRPISCVLFESPYIHHDNEPNTTSSPCSIGNGSRRPCLQSSFLWFVTGTCVLQCLIFLTSLRTGQRWGSAREYLSRVECHPSFIIRPLSRKTTMVLLMRRTWT